MWSPDLAQLAEHLTVVGEPLFCFLKGGSSYQNVAGSIPAVRISLYSIDGVVVT